MYLLRKSLLPLMAAGTLFAPAAHAAEASGAGPGHGSVFQPATLPPRTRIRRRLRSAKDRMNAQSRVRASGARPTRRPVNENVLPQRASDGTSARGPPRFR
jgi:hypothetical protein